MITCRLSTILGERRMTQVALARKAGVHKNRISALYNDQWDAVSRDVLDRICQALGIGIADLLQRQPDAPDTPAAAPVVRTLWHGGKLW